MDKTKFQKFEIKDRHHLTKINCFIHFYFIKRIGILMA